MATTHGLTVLAHSCIKPPRNPKTGLSSTWHERANAYHTFVLQNSDTDFNANSKNQDGHDDFGRSVHVYTNPAIDEISSQLQDLDDNEFYQKLLKLKNEHKKTLYLCEQLYKKKISSDKPQSNGLPLDDEPISSNVYLDGRHEDENARDRYIERDVIQTTASKPPTGRQQFHTSPMSKKAGFSTMPLPRPSSAPVYRRRGSLTKSLEEEVWAKIASERGQQRERADSDDELNTERLLRTSDDIVRSSDEPELAAAMTRIEDMWENFSVEDYAPRQVKERPSSASVTRREKEKEKEWRHRITIPKPFKMTLREASKEKTKSKLQLEHEQKLIEEKVKEDLECQKKFKAQPVPAHVYIPLYDEINEKNEARKRYIKQYSQELLKSQEKPFKFHTREREDEKHVRTSSEPVERDVHTFKARPVPGYLYDSSIDDQLKEEEEYRKIRIKLRAEEMYRKSQMPENMEMRQKIKDMKAKEKKIKSKRKSASASKVKHEVPDYEELYRHFQKELLRRKQEREGTVVKPFKLSTASTTKRERILEDMKRDEEVLKENRWPYMTPRTTPRKSLGYLSNSLDSLPASSTKATDLRTETVKCKKGILKDREQQEIEQDRKRRINEMRLRRSIQERTGADLQPTLEETTLRKLRSCREAERERIEQYEKELAEMKERVDRRPLLVEQQSQVNAKNAVNKKFTATLRSVGLDEDFVQTRSSHAGSVRDDTADDYDDDFDASYSKSRDESLQAES
ncbi:protein FAM161A-like [Saccostrea cucullata]|uniref:protein FAM161A-like n=1 Tax=Saccostrea cuccullata TaxID=36930 RepID=UPI002ED0FF29